MTSFFFFTTVQPLHLSEVDVCSDENLSSTVHLNNNTYGILNDGDLATCLDVSWTTAVCYFYYIIS